jgi:hypothetical protein
MKRFFLLILLVCLSLKSEMVEICHVYDPYDYLHKNLLRECHFIHEDNFRNIDPEIFSLMIDECDKYDLPYTIFFSLVDKESGFRFISNSEGSGAIGYMQLMPKTFSKNARRLGLEKHTPENNIKVGAYHLNDLFKRWKRKYKSDEMAWNWTIAQYTVGLGGLQVKDGHVIRYQIPEKIKPGIRKVMRNWK